MSDVVTLQPSTAETLSKLQSDRLEKKGIKDSKARIVAEAVAALAKQELHG